MSDTERLLSTLRRSGGRVTAARRAIVEALVNANGDLSAEDITALVQRDNPDLHQATVYRTLEALEVAGLVEHVHFGHGAAAWHLTGDRRFHLVCQRCEQVVHVPPELFEELAEVLRADYGFDVQLGHFAIPGVCSHCRPAGSTS